MHDRLIDTTIACWNEADAARRAALAGEAFTAAADGPAVAAGTDIAELAGDGRFARVIGFIDLAPEA